MASKWTVAPETDEYDVTALGETFKVWFKRRLSVGERKRIDAGGFRGMTGFAKKGETEERETEIGIDWQRQAFARMFGYLTDWTHADDKGNKLKIEDTLLNLRQEVFDAIEAKLNAHVERLEKEKNAQAG